MRQNLSSIAHAAYHDLLCSLKDEVASKIYRHGEACEDALARGPKRRERIAATLKRRPATKTRLAAIGVKLSV